MTTIPVKFSLNYITVWDFHKIREEIKDDAADWVEKKRLMNKKGHNKWIQTKDNYKKCSFEN